MNNKERLKVGQTVYLKTVGNMARYGEEILERKITKVAINILMLAVLNLK